MSNIDYARELDELIELVIREGGSDYQRALAVAVPFIGYQLCHMLVQRFAIDI